ncbi:MAG: sugar-binding protein, partial [Chloroflexales bacterium]|nr:sugar-binding protein [Chloroflexales bacterium]
MARNKSPSGDFNWDHYTLVFAGRSFDVVRGEAPINGVYGDESIKDLSNWHWHAVDENFVKVRALSNSHWRVWSKDGTRYDFTQPLYWAWDDPDNPADLYEPYKWLLTEVADRHDNQIVYDYVIDQYPLAPNPGDSIVHPTYHLHSINWGPARSASDPTQRRYRVRFEVRERASATPGVDAEWEHNNLQVYGKEGASHERYQLDRIAVEVFQDHSGGYDPVRSYTLRYAPSSASLYSDDVGRYANGDPEGQRVLTLTEIQPAGTAGGV